MSLLRAEGITVEFENSKIIEDVSIELREGETVSLLGVSGTGKTTLFNVLSGLLTPLQGRVYLEDEDITGKAGKISYMLQKDLLLEHKAVIDNACLPLIIRGMKKKEAREKARELFPVFGLEGTEKKYPHQLSGGMRQRAAFLRTYLSSQRAILLDEPFSALDTITKSGIHSWFTEVSRQLGLSSLIVTHDTDEAILLSDRIYILSGSPGKITTEIPVTLSRDKNERSNLSEDFISLKEAILKKTGILP